MVEAFATGYSGLKPEVWDRQLFQYESALRQGKSVVALSQGDLVRTTSEDIQAIVLGMSDGQLLQ